jgi:hypothetical protein
MLSLKSVTAARLKWAKHPGQLPARDWQRLVGNLFKRFHHRRWHGEVKS